MKEAVTRIRDRKRHGEPPDPVDDTGRPRPFFLSGKPDESKLISKQTDILAKIRSSDPGVGISGSKHPGKDLHPVTEKSDDQNHPGPQDEPHANPSRANPAVLWESLVTRQGDPVRPSTLAQCDASLDLIVDGVPVAIDTQIQLYATNAQLCHPWISPVLGYMGGLPPLFICAGNNEVLRDEIIYL